MTNHGLSGPAARQRLIRKIEAEYQEPVREVIRIYRRQGNTWRTIAGALGINLNTLVLWRKALDLPVDQNAKQYDALSFANRDRY